MDDPNQKFQPPASNIFVRTMQDDLNTLQNSGGQMPNIAGQPVEAPYNPQYNSQPTNVPVSNAPIGQMRNAGVMPSGPAANNNINQAMNNQPVGFGQEVAGPPGEPPLFTAEGMAGGNNFYQAPEAPAKKPTSKIVMIGIIFLIVAALGALGYFVIYPRFIKGKTPVISLPAGDKYTCTFQYQCVSNPLGTDSSLADCQSHCTAPITPTSTPSVMPLSNVQQQYRAQVLPLNLGTSCATVLSTIKTEAKVQASVDVFKIIIPKVRSEYLTNLEIATAFIPKLPSEVSSALNGKYLVFAYYGETNASLGLALEIKPAQAEALKNYLLVWEKKTLTNDLANFFLITPTAKPKSLTAYKSRTQLGAYVRDLTYPKPQTVLGYAITADHLIITTSAEAMNSAISHLQAGGIAPVIQ